MDFGHLIDLEEKSLTENDDAFRFVGYAAVFNNRDLGDDVIVPGAFQKSLKDHGMPLLLFNHKMEDLPIGVIEHAEEDKKGLRVEGELPKDDPVSRRVGIALKARKSGARALKGMSIGYKAEKHSRKGEIRYLEQVRLFEASFVNLPMNPLAGVETIKGAGILGIDEFKEMLRNGDPRGLDARLKAETPSADLRGYLIRLAREELDRKGAREERSAKGQREAGVSADLTGGVADLLAALQQTAKRM